ncbi:MAG: LmbE family protein [Crocinitomicaceae bacterium]|jgi:bacillithiol biosynthesis deacetylase BshB1|nr:LmbE family protein [Crocinitomicaceae bacterium]
MKVDILAFAAHPDDVELSAAGTLIKHIKAGKKVALVDLTQGELGSRGTIETRYKEAADASQVMGISARANLKMEDGFFTHSQENLLKIIEQIRYFKPEIVLCNAIDDRHPDHGRASKLVSEACFLSGLRKIETGHDENKQEAHRPKAVYHYIQDRYIQPDFVIDVTEYVEQKFEAVRAYKTQFYDPNSKEPKTPISGEEFFDFLRGRMAEFGRAIGVQYAEGFTVERIPGVESLFDLN